jgi:hypothetical protein
MAQEGPALRSSVVGGVCMAHAPQFLTLPFMFRLQLDRQRVGQG